MIREILVKMDGRLMVLMGVIAVIITLIITATARDINGSPVIIVGFGYIITGIVALLYQYSLRQPLQPLFNSKNKNIKTNRQ